jgi:hypothetical protein
MQPGGEQSEELVPGPRRRAGRAEAARVGTPSAVASDSASG